MPNSLTQPRIWAQIFVANWTRVMKIHFSDNLGKRNILIKYYQKTLRLSDGYSLPPLLTIPTHLLNKMASDKFSMPVSCTCSSVRVGLWGLLRVRDSQGRSLGCVRVSVHLGNGNLTLSLSIWTQKQFQNILANFENWYFWNKANIQNVDITVHLPWSHLHLCNISSW